MLLLKYNLESNLDALPGLIKAANTDEIVQFERGELCKVIIRNLNPDEKAVLLSKIEAIGISSFHIIESSRGGGSHDKKGGFFKSYRLKIFSFDISNSVLIFKDKSRYELSINVSPLAKVNPKPKSKAEEADFIKAGGRIERRGCSVS
jgi:hypothetical protein